MNNNKDKEFIPVQNNKSNNNEIKNPAEKGIAETKEQVNDTLMEGTIDNVVQEENKK